MTLCFTQFNNDFKETIDYHAAIKITKLCGNTKPKTVGILRKHL